jgi:kumamolisin
MSRGKITGEVAWNATAFGQPMASGGGMSGWFKRPAFQSTLPALKKRSGIWVRTGKSTAFNGRLVPDVSAHADPALGYSIVLGGLPFYGAGTSASAPLWAALLACIAEQIGRPVGWVNKQLARAAKAGAFTDITKGDNTITGAKRGFDAGPGWDACTGYGTPNGKRLADVLAAKR